MTGIILTGHGNIATGIESAVKLVFGQPEKFYAQDFTENITPELLEQKIIENINEIKECSTDDGNGVLILSDIAGGTPFKTDSLISLKSENIKVVSGMNLPMILEIICEREGMGLEELYYHAMTTGKDEIKGFELKDKGTSEKKEEIFEEEGI